MDQNTIVQYTLGGAIGLLISISVLAYKLAKNTMTKKEVEDYVKEKTPSIFQENWENKMSNEYSELNLKFPDMKRYDGLVKAVNKIPSSLKDTFVTKDELKIFAVELIKEVKEELKKEFVSGSDFEKTLLVRSNIEQQNYNKIHKMIAELTKEVSGLSSGIKAANHYLEATEKEIQEISNATAILCHEHKINFKKGA